MAEISAFDVIGPNMIGPSSSHTAGAAAIALLARKILANMPVRVEFTLYGSFASTYRGHGTDRALLGGILGMGPDDTRIPDSFRLADEAGLKFSFTPDTEETDLHPNTVDILVADADGKTVAARGESIGGGKVRITRINNVDVDFTGEYDTIIITHQDSKGVLAHITRCLSAENVNIAFLKLFREARGSSACCVVECDGRIPDEVAQRIRENPHVLDVSLIHPHMGL